MNPISFKGTFTVNPSIYLANKGNESEFLEQIPLFKQYAKEQLPEDVFIEVGHDANLNKLTLKSKDGKGTINNLKMTFKECLEKGRELNKNCILVFMDTVAESLKNVAR